MGKEYTHIQAVEKEVLEMKIEGKSKCRFASQENPLIGFSQGKTLHRTVLPPVPDSLTYFKTLGRRPKPCKVLKNLGQNFYFYKFNRNRETFGFNKQV